MGNFTFVNNASKRTTWYIFFNKSEENILVNYISNNHLSDSRFLNILS